MKRFYFRSLAPLALVVCGYLSAVANAGWFDMDESIHMTESKAKGLNVPAVKYAVTMRITGYVDGRKDMAPKKIGIKTGRVSGIMGRELLLDRDVTDLVATSVRKRFDDAGFQFVDGQGAAALYELSGVVKELTYDVKAKDEVAIAIETTLKEAATGKVVWSGVVEERPAGRFAGVSGNSRGDIANYLRYELGIVTQKTLDAVSGSLMASRPELFNLTPGTKAIAGVTVLQAAGANAPAAPVLVPALAGNGTLALSTRPARAKVYLDGVYFGMSPLRVEVEAGIHEVGVKLDGYKAATEKVSVRKGDITELELMLER